MAPSFRAFPPKILFHNANVHGGGHYRMLIPSRLLRNNGYAVTQSSPQMLESQHLEIMNPDVVVFQHQHTKLQIETMKRYRKTLKRAFFVYEIDDPFWHVPESSVHKSQIPDGIDRHVAEAAKICNAVTVTTPALAAEMRRITRMKDIRVLPNQMPKQFLNAAIEASRKKMPGEKIRIGWAGGIGHAGDLEIAAEIMRKYSESERFQWVFMGMAPPGIDPSRFEYRQAVPFESYAAALGALHLDIALAPLQSNIFNECKSDLRVIEYGAAGFAVIASDLPTFADCPVIKAGEGADAWIAAIEDLANDEDLRFGEAERLHQWVLQHRLMEQHLPEYEAAYLPAASVSFLPTQPVAAGRLVAVGGAVAGLDHFETTQDAWREVPGCSILFMRPGAEISRLQIERLKDAAGTGVASICPLSNDGFFPQMANFSPMVQDTGNRLNTAASLIAVEPTSHAYPYGPCVLLSSAALARYGVPDEDQFGGLELALPDWGARTAEGGMQHLVVGNVFVWTPSPGPATKEMAQHLMQHAVAWTPPFLGALSSYMQTDPLKEIRRDLDLTYHALNYDFPVPDQTYADWARVFDTPGAADRLAMMAEQDGWGDKGPLISVVMPVFNPPENFLAVAIESVINQTYANWELCIADDASTSPLTKTVLEQYAAQDSRIHVVTRSENGHICKASNSALEIASGELVCFLDHDDVLAPHALFTVAAAALEHPNAKFIYSDSDKLSPGGVRIDPYFAPNFNYELLLGQNYVTHLAVYRWEGVRRIGGFRVGYEGSQDWDLTLRYLDSECGAPPYAGFVHHIPHVLYHWRQVEGSTSANIAAKPYALMAGHNAVKDHLRRHNRQAIVGPSPLVPIFNLVRFMPPEDALPLVSILIPTKDNLQTLRICLSSLIERTEYKNYEILIADTGSRDKLFLKELNEWQKQPNIRILRCPGPFNYSAVNNAAAGQAKGEVLCLLNDDTEILESAWLRDLVGAALQPGVGAVGPKLCYPDGTVQQCGTLFSPAGAPLMSALHAFQKLPMMHPGHFGRAALPQVFMAVTGACLVIQKSVYLQAQGLDESFPLDFNDVDFCLRLHALGYRNLVLPHIVVRHHEGFTKRRNLPAETWSRIAGDEMRLRHRHSDTVDLNLNHNLMFTPSFDKLRIPGPAKPWTTDDRERLLMINGTKDEAIRAFQDGYLTYTAALEGHFLVLNNPVISNLEPLDLREDPDKLLEVLAKLGISRIVFCGIGNGTLGAVGYLTRVSREGWPVAFAPNGSARAENPNDYIDPIGWQNTWAAFHAAMKANSNGSADKDQDSARAENYV